MSDRLKFFIAYLIIVLPLNLLVSYFTDGHHLTIKAFAGDLVVTLLIYFIISRISTAAKTANKK